MKHASSKSVLVSLNEVSQLPQLLAAARALGTWFDAHVTGVYVLPAAQVYPMVGYDAVPETYDGNRQFFAKNLDDVKQKFEAAMKADGIAYTFQQVEGRTPQIAIDAAERARAHDLVVIALPQDDGASGFESDFAERMVMLAGRPVLVLPRKGKMELNLDEVVLGWDGGREAARAVFDAMPLLRHATRVRIVGIDVAPRGVEPGADIAEALAHHGVTTEVTHVSSDGMTSGETLLRSAADFGAGLLVMGAYGHSRFTEFIFGGATRHVFRHMNLPVLMSH